ncbi:10694_t:CDS:1 [Scutellospora calospora]|uniref:10694_t:CDS:1 n=1 Tax=Scutellospora calospora TaxID=85575 RepID=A0ACA9P7U8_9GLOM|nr:10694_t:CDS:1 [Scutellospora calospora]
MPDTSEIDFDDLIKTCSKDSKSMNGYFIYRNEYKKQVIANGIKLKMTEISKLSGAAWKNEKCEVKDAYKNLSKQLDDELKRRKKEAGQIYNIVFDNHMEKVTPTQSSHGSPVLMNTSIEPLSLINTTDSFYSEETNISMVSFYSENTEMNTHSFFPEMNMLPNIPLFSPEMNMYLLYPATSIPLFSPEINMHSLYPEETEMLLNVDHSL